MLRLGGKDQKGEAAQTTSPRSVWWPRDTIIADRLAGTSRAFPLVMLSQRDLHSTRRGRLSIMTAPIGTTARTGENCPESGVWKVVGSPSTTAPIARGNRMPPYDGKAVTWQLTRYA